MYAVVKDGGRQYTVCPGDSLSIDRRELNEGDEVVFDDVLLMADGDDVRIGAPTIEGAKVRAVVEAQEKARKVWTVKFRRRKDSKTTRGHRQKMTRVKITDIVVS